MSYLQEIRTSATVLPVDYMLWDQDTPGRDETKQPRTYWRVTRSTVALNASDLLELDRDGQLETLVHAFSIARRLNREEVVIERLDLLNERLGDIGVANAQSILQGIVTRACAALGFPLPRVALEKWSYGYDLRVYLPKLS